MAEQIGQVRRVLVVEGETQGIYILGLKCFLNRAPESIPSLLHFPFGQDFLWRGRWYIRQVILLYRLLIACFTRSTPVPCAATPSTR